MDPLTIAIVGGFIAGLGVAGSIALARRSGRVMGWFKRYFLGLEFLVVGHPRAGKTSFYNYLQFGRFADEYPVRPTLRVSDRMRFDVDKGGDLKFSVASSFDIPGELPPPEQVRMIRRRRPQALIVFTSADDPEAVSWLGMLLEDLTIVLAQDRQLARKLRSLTVVVNKRDTVDSEQFDSLVASTRSTVYDRMKKVLGKNVNLVDVVPCTLLRKGGGEKAANEVILAVVESMQLRRRLVP